MSTHVMSWDFTLGDRMSAAAKGMSTALDKVLNKLKANDRAIVGVEKRTKAFGAAASGTRSGLGAETDAVKKANAALDKHADALAKAAAATGRLRDARGRFLGGGGGSKGMFGGLGLPSIPGLGAMGGLLGAGYLAKQGFDAGLNLLVKGVQEASFKRNAISQSQMLGDSPAQARSTYDWMMKLSDATAFNDQTVVGGVNKFRSAGFGLKETETLMLGIADAAGTSAENAAEMVNQFLQIKSVGKVTLDNLNTFLERTGGVLGRDDIFGRVAQRRGVSAKTMNREEVTFDEFANAFLDAVQSKLNRGGLFGARSVKLGRETIEGQWEALKNNYDRLFRDVGVDPVVNMLERLNKELTGAFGDDLKLGINKLFSDTFDSLFGKYQGAGGFDRLKDDLKQLGERALTFAAALEKIVVAAAKVADLGLKAAGGASTVWTATFGSGAERADADARMSRWARDTLGAPSWMFTQDKLNAMASLDLRERLASGGSIADLPLDESVPKLASGGVVRRPTMAIVGEAGPEAIVPLSGGRGLGSSQITIVQNIHGASDELARRVAEETRRALTEALEALSLRAGVA
jgi:hypothetical protein